MYTFGVTIDVISSMISMLMKKEPDRRKFPTICGNKSLAMKAFRLSDNFNLTLGLLSLKAVTPGGNVKYRKLSKHRTLNKFHIL